MLGNFRTHSSSLPPSGVFFPSFFIYNSSKVKTITYLRCAPFLLNGQDGWSGGKGDIIYYSVWDVWWIWTNMYVYIFPEGWVKKKIKPRNDDFIHSNFNWFFVSILFSTVFEWPMLEWTFQRSKSVMSFWPRRGERGTSFIGVGVKVDLGKSVQMTRFVRVILYTANLNKTICPMKWNDSNIFICQRSVCEKGGENLCQIPPPITMHQGCNPWCTKGAIRNAPNPQNTQKWLFLAGLHLPCSPWCTSQEKLDIPHLTCLAASLFQSVIRDAW